jgi:hypothetical protein
VRADASIAKAFNKTEGGGEVIDLPALPLRRKIA